ncbi:MAG: PIN domain-containing protein [Actinobacteria bacterium]|nr:PIN domain-containing protein [Actinomycetota bacterium]
MSASRVFADTNVLAYALDASNEVKQQQAQHLLAAHGGQLVISTQVLLELFAVCNRKLSMSSADAAAAVRAAARLDVVPADRSLMLGAAALAAEQELSVFDAAIACAAIRAECELLLTEDFALARAIDGLQVVNPFT